MQQRCFWCLYDNIRQGTSRVRMVGYACWFISHGDPTIVLFADASSTWWGCSLNDISTSGNWTAEEANNHINYLELRAIFLALDLQSFSLIIKGQHVKVMADDMSDLNRHMGTNSSEKRNDLAKEIWLWCGEQNIWLTAVHVPGVENVEADRQSRLPHSPLEWTLDKFLKIASMNLMFSQLLIYLHPIR